MHGFDGLLARDLPSRVAAHPVSNDIQAEAVID